MVLKLINKIVSKWVTGYTFEVNGVKAVYTIEQAVYMINQTPASQRNCRLTSSTTIGFKSGYGPLQTIQNESENNNVVRLYTSKKYAPKIEAIVSEDSFFSSVILRHGARWLLEEEQEVMQKIDGAKLRAEGIVETPFGAVAVQGLSTGCKTVLNLLYCAKYGPKYNINAIECGCNALDILFEKAAKYNMPILFERYGVLQCKEGPTFIINNTDTVSSIRSLEYCIQKWMDEERKND